MVKCVALERLNLLKVRATLFTLHLPAAAGHVSPEEILVEGGVTFPLPSSIPTPGASPGWGGDQLSPTPLP